MTVTIEKTAKKYRGRKALTYDSIREKQQRWKLENEAVAKLLGHDPTIRSVLDCPVGTGRFLQLYAELNIPRVWGVDVSDEMLVLAHKKLNKLRSSKLTAALTIGDAAKMDFPDGHFDAAVCVRFLDLIDESAMRLVVGELCRVTRRAVVLTIRLGDTYVPKVNTAEHDRHKFNALVRRLGWRVAETVPIFDAGWVVMRLGRRK